MDKLLLTPKEATELLGIQPKQALRAAASEHDRVGQDRRLPAGARAALDEYVERLRREAVA